MTYGEDTPETSARLREMILHIASKRPDLTMEEIGTMCWLIDSEAFRRTGKPIIGCTYVK
jgi:hypothetical protein